MALEDWIGLDQRLLLLLNGSNSLFFDHLMNGITSTVAWIPVAVVLFYVLVKNNSMREVGLIVLFLALSILLADQFSSSFCKPYFARFRPAQDPLLMYLVDVVDGYRGGRYGFISSHVKELIVCIKKFIIFFVCSIYDKCPRKVFRDILKRESQLFTFASLNTFLVSHTSIFSMKFYFIKSYICTTHKL